MAEFAWIMPALAGFVLLFVLIKLAKSASKLQRQGKRLEKSIRAFQETDHSESLKSPKFTVRALDEAISERKQLQRTRAKAKSERQRRLVSRLKNLESNKRK